MYQEQQPILHVAVVLLLLDEHISDITKANIYLAQGSIGRPNCPPLLPSWLFLENRNLLSSDIGRSDSLDIKAETKRSLIQAFTCSLAKINHQPL